MSITLSWNIELCYILPYLSW